MARKRNKNLMFNSDYSKHNETSRSQSYQWRILELPYDFTPPPPRSNTSVHQWSNSDSLYAHINPYQYNEQYLDLKDDLLARFWQLAKNVLTPLQLSIITMYAEGMTQKEIAKKLGVNQSSVSKNILGNTDYSDDTHSKQFGGSMKKLRKAVQEDSIMQEIVEKMKDLRENIL